jgi:hypothetical protein
VSKQVVINVVPLPGDVNRDGVVNCLDLAAIRAALGLRAGDAGYQAALDLNGDGVIDILDLSFVALRLPAGTSCP